MESKTTYYYHAMFSIEALLLLSNILMIWNIYLPFHDDTSSPCQLLTDCCADAGRRPTIWMYGQNKSACKAVNPFIATSFHRKGYVMASNIDLRAYEYDLFHTDHLLYLDKEALNIIHNRARTSKTRQVTFETRDKTYELHEVPFKVNHIRDIGLICNKALFITRTEGPAKKYIPKGFLIPEEKHEFMAEVEKYPEKLWVEKNRGHRGTKIVRSYDVDLEADNTDKLVQEFVGNPYLVNNRKFYMGVYVIITSVNPLRVYAHEDIHPWFCAKEYYPFDINDLAKHLTGDHDVQRSAEELIEELEKFGTEKYMYSERRMLERHMEDNNRIHGRIVYEQIYDAIVKVLYSHWGDFQNSIKQTSIYNNNDLNSAAFEVTRWDFMLDNDANLVMLEANMSPKMDTGIYNTTQGNARLQVWDSIINLLGLPQNYIVAKNKSISQDENVSVNVKDSDIYVDEAVCYTTQCMECYQGCELCPKCLSDEDIDMLKSAFREHLNRKTMRRVIPFPKEQMLNLEAGLPNLKRMYSHKDMMLSRWFSSKCAQDKYWCN